MDQFLSPEPTWLCKPHPEEVIVGTDVTEPEVAVEPSVTGRDNT